MNEKPTFLLVIECMTYNQSAYITDAMNGFVMQQTNFPFLALIIDDASTDGEQKVIRNYIDEHFDHSLESGFKEWETEDALWTFAQHGENRNCHFVIVYLKKNLFKDPEKKAEVVKDWCNSKYIAICEGDDYWTDSLKLQKQVDFLERHEEFSMCFHAAKISLEGVDASAIGAACDNIENREYLSTEVFERWIVPTASIVYRQSDTRDFVVKHPEWLTRGDICLVLKCAHVGKIFGMKDCMSVYRMQPNSVSHSAEYRGKEVYILPNHFRCIYINFPKVDKAPIKWNISHAYYSRMKAEKGVIRKVRDFVLFVCWDPRWAFQKITQLAKKALI